MRFPNVKVRLAKDDPAVPDMESPDFEPPSFDLEEDDEPCWRPPATPKPRSPSGRYSSRDGCLWLEKVNKTGTQKIQLTNFTATITREVALDDGDSVQREFEISASGQGWKRRMLIPATEFNSVAQWATGKLGAGAIVYPKMAEEARAAIQELSRDVKAETIYTHTGWAALPGGYAYLHGAGAISGSGLVADVQVRLRGGLKRYSLPAPPTGDDLRAAVTASLRMLDTCPDHVTFPVFAALWRVPLGHVGLTLGLTGKTGSGKTELGALGQRHYGKDFDAEHLPGSWSTTENALEAQAFITKDALFTIDDFAPTPSNEKAMHAKAERVIRAQGNASGRDRLDSSANLQGTRPPRGLILSTGEDVPRGQSLRGRMVIIEVAHGDMRWDVLTACQRDAAAGLYASAMSAYLRWLAPQLEAVQKTMRSEIDALRDGKFAAFRAHPRTPTNFANLAYGLQQFLRFAVAEGALTESDTAALNERMAAALARLAGTQGANQSASDPTDQFLEHVRTALASGRAHLADQFGETPRDAEAWGWRQADESEDRWQPQGSRIGWLVKDDVYLDPGAAFTVVQAVGGGLGERLPLTPRTLAQRLEQRGLLASTERGSRDTPTVRKKLAGVTRAVLHFKAATLMSEDVSA
jgi:hypothetical protein